MRAPPILMALQRRLGPAARRGQCGLKGATEVQDRVRDCAWFAPKVNGVPTSQLFGHVVVETE